MTPRAAPSMFRNRHLPLAFGLAVAALVVGPASGGDDPPGTPVPSDPVFTALLTDGTTASGQIRRLGADSGVSLVSGAGAERAIPADNLVKLTREGAPPPSTGDRGDIVLFPDGDRLAHCKVGRAGESNLTVQSLALEELAIPLESILGLILESPPEPDAIDALMGRVRSEPRESELLWLANGDKLPGSFAGLDEKNVSLRTAAARVDLDRSGVVALGFAPAQVSYRRPEGPFLELTLGDGSRLGVTSARVERGQIVATTRFKAEIRLPIGELAQVHALNAAVAYLSDREPNGSQYVPYLGPTRPYRRDATVAGEVLHLGGRAFDRGLGMQSRTLLAYKLEPGSRRFQALIGLDDRVGPVGNAAFKVLVDGKVRYESPPMAAREAPRAVDVDLSGARLLILITEFGERGDVQDHADWVEARIIR